jgi:hypothetical protein
MYCSACGLEATVEVNYCKRCGNTLGPQTALQVRPISLTGPSWAMGITVVAMIGIIFAAVVNLAQLGVSAVALTWMVIVGLGTVVALVAMIFRQLSHSFTANQSSLPAAPTKPQITGELYQPRRDALPEHMPSVTEHTTRTFEPAYREPIQRNK